MWHLIKFDDRFGYWLLYEGTPDGYRFTKIWQYKVTARIYAKVHRIKFISK